MSLFLNHKFSHGTDLDIFLKGFQMMKSIKIHKFFVKLLIVLFTTIAIISLIATLAYNIYLAPTKVISSSTSPDESVKIDFITQGFFGMTWIDLITPDGYWNNKTKIYSIGGDEVIFPKDLQVFWSEDSSVFLAVSKQDRIITQELKEKEKAELNSGDNLVLMYNIKTKKILHNLVFPRTNFRLYKDDIKKIKWHNCHICK
jgi:hypothetical protein